MDDLQRLRYSRHLLLDEFSEDAQDHLIASRALVIGAGGLGSPALLYLASAGVGHLTVVDPDEVDLTNLQRQVAHTLGRVGQPKVHSVQTAISAIDPTVDVTALAQHADEALLRQEVPRAQVVLDCTDNFATRQLINRVCVESGVPLVSASAVRFDGQISLFDPREPDSPCYACLFPPDSPPEETRCALLGIFAPVVGVMGVMQAGEALKVLLQSAPSGPWSGHQGLAGRLLMLDGRTWRWAEMRARRQPACPVCGSQHDTVA